MARAEKTADRGDTANFYVLNADQFKALLDRSQDETTDAIAQVLRDNRAHNTARHEDQRGIRAPELDAVDFSRWGTWRERFIATVEINGRSNARGRREMSVCITGAARDLIAGVNLGLGSAGVPDNALHRDLDFRPVLQEIKTLLIPASDSDMTRAHLSSAKQEPNEDILKWRSRVRVLWMRAHPNQMIAEAEGNRDLVDLFLQGLARETTKVQT